MLMNTTILGKKLKQPIDKDDYNHLYYLINKEKHLKYVTDKIVCGRCNERVARGHFKRHQNSNKCFKNIIDPMLKKILAMTQLKRQLVFKRCSRK